MKRKERNRRRPSSFREKSDSMLLLFPASEDSLFLLLLRDVFLIDLTISPRSLLRIRVEQRQFFACLAIRAGANGRTNDSNERKGDREA